MLDENVRLEGSDGQPPPLSIPDLGPEDPPFLPSDDTERSPASRIPRHAQRMRIASGIAEAIPFFHVDALSSRADLMVDLDLRITLVASAPERRLGGRRPADDRRAHGGNVSRPLPAWADGSTSHPATSS